MSEATAVLVDNSEWTRSGDYAPTRFQVGMIVVAADLVAAWGKKFCDCSSDRGLELGFAGVGFRGQLMPAVGPCVHPCRHKLTL
jgi:hypothetical protein